MLYLVRLFLIFPCFNQQKIYSLDCEVYVELPPCFEDGSNFCTFGPKVRAWQNRDSNLEIYIYQGGRLPRRRPLCVQPHPLPGGEGEAAGGQVALLPSSSQAGPVECKAETSQTDNMVQPALLRLHVHQAWPGLPLLAGRVHPRWPSPQASPKPSHCTTLLSYHAIPVQDHRRLKHQGVELGQVVRAAAASQQQLQLQRRDRGLPHGGGQVQGHQPSVRGHRLRAGQARRHLCGHICPLLEDSVCKSHQQLPPHWQKGQHQPSGLHLASQGRGQGLHPLLEDPGHPALIQPHHEQLQVVLGGEIHHHAQAGARHHQPA